MHKGHENWILEPDVPLEEHVQDAALMMGDAIKKDYLKLVKVNISEAELAPYYESVGMALAMAQNYQARWGGPIPFGYSCIQPEQKLQLPIPNTLHVCEHCNGTGQLYETENFSVEGTKETRLFNVSIGECKDCEGTGEAFHYLEMRLDGLLRRDHDSSIWVLEHKTFSSRPNEESLLHNDQFLAYMWGCTQIGLGNVGGIAYDGMWVRDKVPRGRTFEDLFVRKLLERKPAEIREFEEYLTIEVERMFNVLQQGKFTFNRRWEGCYDCSVEPVCSAMSRGENYESVIVANYVERTDDVDEEVVVAA